MRRYELMLVLRPDTPDDQVQAVLDRATRSIAATAAARSSRSARGAAAAWPIRSATYREGSYFLIVFEAPATAVLELERGLNITEEVMRHLVTRVERPARRDRQAQSGDESDGRGVGRAAVRGRRGRARHGVHRRVGERSRALAARPLGTAGGRSQCR